MSTAPVVLLVLLGVNLAMSQECMYQYLRQPPSEINDCDPYSTTGDLVLQCQASVPTSSVEIHWFNRNKRITLENFFPLAHKIEQVVSKNGTDRHIITSTMRTRFITADGYGSWSYHCQIVAGGSESTAISNQLVINPNREIYASNGDCAITYFEESTSCAKYSPTTTTTAAIEALTPKTSAATAIPITPATEDLNTTGSTALNNATAPPKAAPPTSAGTDIAEGFHLQLWVYILFTLLVLFGASNIGLCLLHKRRKARNHVTADQEIPPSSLVGYQIDVKDHIYGVPIEQTKKYEFYGISNTPGLWQ